MLSHLASLVHAASLFSFGTRINLIAVYEAAVVSQIEVDRRVGRLLDGKTDGQGRDLKQGDLPLKSEMNMQTRSAVRKTGERQFLNFFFFYRKLERWCTKWKHESLMTQKQLRLRNPLRLKLNK